MNALQTYMLDPTPRMDRVPITMGPYIKFNILDFSGNNDLKDLSPPEITALENCGVMIFVLDIQVNFMKKPIYLRLILMSMLLNT